MVFEVLQHTFKWNVRLKLVNPSKDFMIAVEALIKPLGYQKKLN